MLTDFQNSFIVRFNSKFATKSSLTISPHLNCVSTLPCELAVFKKLPCSKPKCMKQALCETEPLKTVV